MSPTEPPLRAELGSTTLKVDEMHVLEPECEFAGIDPKQVASIARRISKAAQEAASIGVSIFGGSGTGSLRCAGPDDSIRDGAVVLAHLDGSFDGGDGAEHEDKQGITRGEDG